MVNARAGRCSWGTIVLSRERKELNDLKKKVGTRRQGLGIVPVY